MNRFLDWLPRSIERVTEAAGIIGALFLPLLILVVVGNVVLRYGFGLGLVELEELQWHLNAVTIMLCLGYAYRHDAHVRVDVLRDEWSATRKAWVEVIGILLLLLPFTIGIMWFSWNSFAYSWKIGEGSPMPSGLPARYLVRLLLFFGFALLAAQALASLLRAVQIIRSDVSGDRT